MAGWACAVCYGESDAPMSRGLTWAVVVLAGMVGRGKKSVKMPTSRAHRPRSLYDYGLATYDAADRFRHADSEGFARIWGLGVQTWSGVQGPGSNT